MKKGLLGLQFWVLSPSLKSQQQVQHSTTRLLSSSSKRMLITRNRERCHNGTGKIVISHYSNNAFISTHIVFESCVWYVLESANSESDRRLYDPIANATYQSSIATASPWMEWTSGIILLYILRTNTHRRNIPTHYYNRRVSSNITSLRLLTFLFATH